MSNSSPNLNVTGNDVIYDFSENIATITINRPDFANSLNANAINLITKYINEICDKDEARVVVFKAVGTIFCAGGDIGLFSSRSSDLGSLMDELLTPFNKALLRIYNSRIPIVSAINGSVGGGGIGIGLCADFVLASESMKLRSGYSAIGLTPDVGSSWFLTKRAGPVKAKQILISNDVIGSRACLDFGIVDYVYPDAELDAKVFALTKSLAEKPNKSLRRIKELVDGAYQRSFEQHLDLERVFMVSSGSESDAFEGVAAFLEKRPAVFNQ